MRRGETAGHPGDLDGVFSHTAATACTSTGEGRYPTDGAYNSQQSPYYSWYTFRKWPNAYDCWWNFDTLPNVNETNDSYNNYINGPEGHRAEMDEGRASGWRLDVADELPDQFLDQLHDAVKAQDPQGLILGEVWEDASNKSAYGVRRRYLLGRQLDTVMNYPFRDAILGFLLGEEPPALRRTVETIVENYPPQCLNLLMNHIGTHRHRTGPHRAGGRARRQAGGREWQAEQSLSPQQRGHGPEAPEAGGPDPVPAPRGALRVLRGRGRLRGLPGPLQPGVLPLGARRTRTCSPGTGSWASSGPLTKTCWPKGCTAP